MVWPLISPKYEREQEARDDLFYGQVVLIVARWFLIAAGIVLALWTAHSIAEVTIPIGFMMALMVMNFYLHGRYLMKQPLNAAVVYASSAMDLVVITGIVLFSSAGNGVGLTNPYFVFLYPTLLAFALIFSPRMTFGFAVVAVGTYVIAILTQSDLTSVDAQKVLLQRLVTLGATAGLGTYFWRIQREQRRRARSHLERLWQQKSIFSGQPEQVG